MLKNLLTAAVLALPEPWPYLTVCLLFLVHQTKKGWQWPALKQYWKAYSTSPGSSSTLRSGTSRA